MCVCVLYIWLMMMMVKKIAVSFSLTQCVKTESKKKKIFWVKVLCFYFLNNNKKKIPDTEITKCSNQWRSIKNKNFHYTYRFYDVFLFLD